MQNSFHLITSLTGERSPVTSGMIYWAGIKQSSSPGPCSEHIEVRVMLWLSGAPGSVCVCGGGGFKASVCF